MRSSRSFITRHVSLVTVFCLTLLLLPLAAGADSVLDSPHNLSASGPGRISAPGEERVCVFCHNVHHAEILSDPEYPGPLWGRMENTSHYTLYESPSLVANPGQPMGPSRLCLSCHDGTIALGAPAAHGVKAILPSLESYPPPPSPQKSAVLGTNLSDDHPVSMAYAVDPREFFSPGETRLNNIKLIDRGGTLYVECTSCHDAHDNRYGNFLVLDTSTQADALCTACHNRTGWTGSAHATGGDRFPGSVADEVAGNGCQSCHVSHSAQRGAALLRLPHVDAGFDTNCYVSCHNGSYPYSDLPAQFNPAGRYTHPLLYDAGAEQHFPAESLPLDGSAKHVHCVDCHNPHQTLWQDAPLAADRAPAVNGLLKSVRGVDLGGSTLDAALYEYQVCFKCHSGVSAEAGDFNDILLTVTRQFSSFDQSERFDPSTTVSFHPVAAMRSGTGGSLLPTANTDYIYCSSCHDPHGSGEPHMLRAGNLDGVSAGQGTSYPLCYSCHDETYLMNNALSAALHKAHVFGNHLSGNTDQVACSVCHDPHGVPAFSTGPGEGQHLVNFDTRYVNSAASYDGGNYSCQVSGQGTDAYTCHPTGEVRFYLPYPFAP